MTQSQGPPVSVKAALRCGDRWVLLRNERNEWELPGGRVDGTDATLHEVVRRECAEELGVDVHVGELLDAYLFEVIPGRRVTIICYAATAPAGSAERLSISDEHNAVGLFTTNELDALDLPTGYRRAIALSAARQ